MSNHRRLTLRVLLSYLDDTLDPAEIKDIGERINESEPAKAIIARVKKLIRKRRLTTPPLTGPGAKFDANNIAAYLDNVADNVAELEEFCLREDPSADLYLAEVASCHQILTLVEGEPMMVPATAKQRMYGLVQGREAIPFRKPTKTNTPRLAGSHADIDVDDGSALMGLIPRKSPWLVWTVPAIAALLLVGAGLALFFALPKLTDEPPRERIVAQNKDSGKPRDKDAPIANDKDSVKDKDGAAVKDKDTAIFKDRDGPPVKDKDAAIVKDKDVVKDKDGPVKDGMKEPMKEPEPMKMPDPVKDPPPVLERPVEPSDLRADLATYQMVGKELSILAAKQNGNWKRLLSNTRIATTEPIVALPGYACSVTTNSKIDLLLRGYAPQFVPPEIPQAAASNLNRLLDCSITLHHHPKADADLTLHRGRLYVSNPDKPATVIVRFRGQAWVLHLTEKNTEVAFDLITRYLPQLRAEEPLAELHMVLLKGKMDLQVDTFEFRNLNAQPDPIYYGWNNKGSRMEAPQSVAGLQTVFVKTVPTRKVSNDFQIATRELANLPAWGPKTVSEILKSEGLKSLSRDQRILAIYGLGAIDELGALVDGLGDPDPAHQMEREEASYVIRCWLSRGTKENRELFDPKTGMGVLTSKGFPVNDATILWTLLHGLTPPNAFQQPDDNRSELNLLLGYMANDRVAIRQVAHHLLETISSAVPTRPMLPPFNAADKVEAREGAIKRLREMLEAGQLTPAAGRPKP